MQVESFDNLQKDDGVNIHKPFFCNLHPVESVKFFCNTCQVPVAADVVILRNEQCGIRDPV